MECFTDKGFPIGIISQSPPFLDTVRWIFSKMMRSFKGLSSGPVWNCDHLENSMINCLSSVGICSLYFRDQLVNTKMICSERGIDWRGRVHGMDCSSLLEMTDESAIFVSVSDCCNCVSSTETLVMTGFLIAGPSGFFEVKEQQLRKLIKSINDVRLVGIVVVAWGWEAYRGIRGYGSTGTHPCSPLRNVAVKELHKLFLCVKEDEIGNP